MALSSQVKESINLAIGNLRDALAFAARSEHGICIATISDILMRLESIESVEEIMQKLGHPKSGPGAPTNIRFE